MRILRSFLRYMQIRLVRSRPTLCLTTIQYAQLLNERGPYFSCDHILVMGIVSTSKQSSSRIRSRTNWSYNPCRHNLNPELALVVCEPPGQYRMRNPKPKTRYKHDRFWNPCLGAAVGNCQNLEGPCIHAA